MGSISEQLRGAGFESKPGAKNRSFQALENDQEQTGKKEPSPKLYKYHHLLLGQWYHSLYQQALINTQREGNVIFTGMPMSEYHAHLNTLSENAGLVVRQGGDVTNRAGDTLYNQFAEDAREAAKDTWQHLPSPDRYDVAFKPEFLFRPLHALRVQQLYGNEELHTYAEEEGLGTLPELIAQVVTDPEFKLPAGRFANGEGALNLERMFAMIRGKTNKDIDQLSEGSGNRHLQLMQLLSYVSSYYFFDFTRDGKIDLNQIDNELQRAVLSASARADMVAFFTEKGDKASKQLVTDFIRSVEEDEISPYAFASMDHATLEKRVKLVDKIRGGDVRLAVIEAKTELRDKKFINGRGYVERTFNQSTIPDHHYADFGFTLFAMYQHLVRLHNIRPEDIAKHRGLMDFQTGSRHDEDPTRRAAFRDALGYVREFRDGLMGDHNIFLVTRAFGNHIDAVAADYSTLRTAKGSGGEYGAYGLKIDHLDELQLTHSVLPIQSTHDRVKLRNATERAGNKLAVNITDRRRPLQETLPDMLQEAI